MDCRASAPVHFSSKAAGVWNADFWESHTTSDICSLLLMPMSCLHTGSLELIMPAQTPNSETTKSDDRFNRHVLGSQKAMAVSSHARTWARARFSSKMHLRWHPPGPSYVGAC